MKWLYKLERKFGKYYIPNLMEIILFGSLAVYLLSVTVIPNLLNMLYLDPSKVIKGEVWRLITFVFVPGSGGNSILIILNLYFMYLIGMALESYWGGFKFNVYFFINYFLTIIACMLTGIPDVVMTNVLSIPGFSISLYLAYATLCPDATFYLFFILPIKAKVMLYINWAIIILQAVEFLINGSLLGVVLTFVPVVNYLIFFGPSTVKEKKERKNNVIRMKDYKKKMNSTKKPYTHKCTVCGLTDIDDPDMDFRYCGECDGKHAYCSKHIKNHKHIKNNKESKTIELKKD